MMLSSAELQIHSPRTIMDAKRQMISEVSSWSDERNTLLVCYDTAPQVAASRPGGKGR